MPKGYCPECKEEKEITQQGIASGMCDECYERRYTCDICGKRVENAWLWINTSVGKGHKECIEGRQAIESDE